jgi:hypothetical protein
MDATGEKMKKITMKEGMGEYSFTGHFVGNEAKELMKILPDAKIDTDEEPGQKYTTTVTSEKYNDKSVEHAVKQAKGEIKNTHSSAGAGVAKFLTKERLKEIIRQEIAGAYGGDAMDAEDGSSYINEALNKDIKVFGQDLDKNLKAAGFNTIITFQLPSSEQQKKVQEDPKSVILYVTLSDQFQSLQLRGNAKSAKELDKIVSKFQVSSWNGPKMAFGSGWDAKTKQVVGGFNPGDIVGGGKGVNGVYYDANFTRYATTQAKTTTDQGGKTTKTQGVTQTMAKPAAQPQQESIDQAINEALNSFRKGK